MAGAVGTITYTEHTGASASVKKIKAAWVSGYGDYAGIVYGSTTEYYAGQIWGAITVPSGTAVPTDNYDIQLLDSDSMDVALGSLLNRDSANIEYVTSASMAAVADSRLNISITNAGTNAVGTLYLYIR